MTRRPQSVELIMYGMQMAAERGKNPGDDLVTKLVQADVEGHKLTDDEFGFFVILLAVAGNETTRNSITQGMMAFTEFPDQWELFKRERPATAADEIVRWATPGHLVPAHRARGHRTVRRARSRRASGW